MFDRELVQESCVMDSLFRSTGLIGDAPSKYRIHPFRFVFRRVEGIRGYYLIAATAKLSFEPLPSVLFREEGELRGCIEGVYSRTNSKLSIPDAIVCVPGKIKNEAASHPDAYCNSMADILCHHFDADMYARQAFIVSAIGPESVSHIGIDYLYPGPVGRF